MVIVVMGVSGCGKSVIGQGLAKSLGWEFRDADSLHSAANVEKMSEGHPLTDADRLPWLESVAKVIADWLETGTGGVIACSALKEEYRSILTGSRADQVKFAYLKGSYELFEGRLSSRKNHFMKANMLRSQFRTLEEPTEALKIDASLPVKSIVDQLTSRVKAITQAE